MDLKRKAFGIVAAVGLAVSTIAGVAAQNAPTVNVRAELTGLCSAVIVQGDNAMNYGTWNYQDGEYVKTGNQSEYKDLHIKVTGEHAGDVCSVTASINAGMVNQDDNSISFGQENLSLALWNEFSLPETALPVTGNVPDRVAPYHVPLHVQPPADTPNGVYVGVLEVTAQDGV